MHNSNWKKWLQCFGSFVLAICFSMLFFQKSIQTYYEQTYARVWFFERPLVQWAVQIQTGINQALSKTSRIFIKEHKVFNHWLSQEEMPMLLQEESTDEQGSRVQIQPPLAQSQREVSKAFKQTNNWVSPYSWIRPISVQLAHQSIDHNFSRLGAESLNHEMNRLVEKIDLEVLSEVSSMLVLDRGDKVFFAGDSLMEGIAPHAIRELYQTHHIESMSKAKVSTGLSYPGFFDWPKTIEQTLNEDPHIKILVMMVGANDTNPIFDPENRGKHIQFDDPRWLSIYRERVQSIYDIAQAHHVRVLWIELPNMRRHLLNKRVQVLNEVYEQEALAHHQHFLKIKADLGMSGDQFSAYSGGETPYKTRTDDGIHFSYRAQKYLAHKILDQIRFLENEPIDLLDPCSIHACEQATTEIKESE